MVIISGISVIFGFLSCGYEDSCDAPLYGDYDLENYVEARVVVRTSLECSDSRVGQYAGKNIKMCGWLVIKNNKIYITSETLHFFENDYYGILIDCTSEIQNAIITYDLSQKCYLDGKLKLEKILDGKGVFCCQMGIRSVTLKRLDDIYFEKEEEKQ